MKSILLLLCCTCFYVLQLEAEPDKVLNLAVQINVTSEISCNGLSDGELLATATGGALSYSYLWNNGQTNSSITGLSAGTYSVTVTDGAGDRGTASIVLNEPPALTNSIAAQDESCLGNNDGSATVTAVGGTPPYVYAWSNGGATSTITGLSPGVYQVTIADDNGCRTTGSVIIGNGSNISVNTIIVTPITCNGGNDGAVAAIAGGGALPYSYLWSNGAAASVINGLSMGIYTVTVTDANNCVETASITLADPPMMLSSIIAQPVSCNGGNDGLASIMVNGGTPPYSFLWDSGQTTPTATGLSSGTASVTVTDANNCTVVESINISEPFLLTVTAAEVQPVSCAGNNDGVGAATANGGTSPYSYLWVNNETTATATGLSAGPNTVTVTDANNCVATTSVMINEASPITFTVSDQPVSCNGGNDGSATINNLAGGTTPYTVDWSDGQTGMTAAGLVAGSYTVTVTDDNACTSVSSFNISEPSLLSATGSVNQVSCNGGNDGEATVSAAGGTAPYSYNWSSGGTAATESGLAVGTYDVTVTDNNGCAVVVSPIAITEPPALTGILTTQSVSCFGENDGSATAVAADGTAPYSYDWSNGMSGGTINGVAAGSVQVTITDSNGCTLVKSGTITSPPLITASATVDAMVSCNGLNDGAATATANGGTGSLSYVWDTGATSASVNNLPAGIFMVTVTDGNNCTETASVTITEPAVLSSSNTSQNVSCNGADDGSASVTVNGGTTPYSYLWSSGQTGASINGLSPGNYMVTATDGNGCEITESVTITEPSVLVANVVIDNQVTCNGEDDGEATVNAMGGTPPYSYLWSNGATSATIVDLAPGQYSATVLDANSCQIVTTTITITEPPVLSGTVTTVDVNCFGSNDGIATASAVGGVGPYTYNWTDGQIGATANNLAAGNIQVAITDATGCTEVINATVGTPTQIVPTAIEDNAVSCYGLQDGAASVSAIGGMPPYTYSWSNGATSTSINNVASGNYTVTVTDSNNCNQVSSVTVTQPALLTATLNGTNVSCNGENDGSVSAVVNGGSVPYSYNWSNGFSSSSINNLQAGNYIVTITDVNGCKTIRSVSVTEPSVLTSSIQLNNNVSCNGGNDGSSTASGFGGTSPYTYAWDNGETNPTANQLSAGSHDVTITDSNGCQTVSSITLTEPGGITGAFPSISSVSCNGGNDGMATVSANGGNGGPFTYAWDNGETSATANSLNAGVHSVTVTDSNGCKKVFSINITQPLALSLAITQDLPASCKGNDEGVASAVGGNGVGPYTYNWSNGTTGPSASGFSAGTHQVTLTDNNGCKLVKQFNIASSFLPMGSVWKYLDNGSNQATAWRSTTFNDASWNSGPAQLGYGDGDEATVVSYGNNSNNKHITTYFRKTINITDSRYTTTGGEISILHDDGAVIYLNGTEIYRSANLPSGNINFNTAATYSWPENSYEDVVVDASNFNMGTNVFAVEIHQRSGNSSDISFDMSLCEAPEPELLRGPYLQLGTENSMILRFRTNLTSRAEIFYGTNPNNLNNSTPLSPAATEHEIQVMGLTADTKYFYEIVLNGAVIVPNTPEHYFVSSPIAGAAGDYRLWFLGDCGTANNNQRAVRNGFINFNGGDAHPDLMLFLGDNAYNNGTDTEYQNAVFENMYENTLRNTVSLSTPGNHDYYSGADADTETGTYYDIFNFPRNGEAGGLASGTEAYYSYDYGNIHVISMDSHDSDRSVGGPMLTWLENDLANTTQEWIIAIWHHPAYSKGSHNSDTESYLIEMRQNALPILEAGGVDLILSGHSHSYERSRFVKGHYGHSSTFNNTMVVQKGAGHASVDSAYCKYSDGHFDGDGMVYITAGASGKVSGGFLNHPVMYYSKSELGSVVVDVNGGTMDVAYVGHDNQVKDQFTINKKANYDPATDQDGDGHTDIDECPTGWPCVDSDGDGEPDIRDLDSDGDNTPDITDPCRLGQGLVASVLLEGALDTNATVMYTTLNTVRRILPGQTPVSGSPPTPAGHPYNTPPWNYTGTEGAGYDDTSYGTDVVDWVLVSLRTNTGATSEVWKAAALLNADGGIEFIDACLPQSMWNGSYYVVIEHRNHMGVMSVNKVNVSDGVYEQDFRTGDSYTANGTGFGQIPMLSGVWAMYAGDLDQNDSPSYDINGSDVLIQSASNGLFNKYLPADANMNGDVNGFDKILWNRNNGRSSRVPR